MPSSRRLRVLGRHTAPPHTPSRVQPSFVYPSAATEVEADTAVLEVAARDLETKGYTLIPSVLNLTELTALRFSLEAHFHTQRTDPYDPGDGPPHHDDTEIEEAWRTMYRTTPPEELERVFRVLRHERARNHGTPWPVPISSVLKNFLPRPMLEGGGASVYAAQVAPTEPILARIVEEPLLLGLARRFLGDDCVLADLSLNSIGPHTDNGAWHVDVPLGQLPEPLPDFPLTLQCVWMVDDFSHRNGASCVVPGSHLTRKKPAWTYGEKMEGEVSVVGPAGSMAVWLSSTWHKPGRNDTDAARRGAICYFSRSWVKPYSDMRPCITAEQAAAMSPSLRYLLGFSAHAPRFR